MKRFKQFLHTSLDVFRIYWEIAPGLTLGVLVTQIISQLQGFVTAYLLGIFVDRVIKIVGTTKDLKEMIPIIAAIGISFLFFDVVGNLNNYFSSILSVIDSSKIKLKQTDFMVMLGISQMEDSELNNKSTRFNEVYNFMSQFLGQLISLIASIVSTFAFGLAVFSFAPIVVFAVLALFFIKFINNGRFINKLWKLSLEHTEERRDAWTSIGYLGDPIYLKEILLDKSTQFLRAKFLKYIDWYNLQYSKIRTRWAIFENLQVVGDATVFIGGMFLLIEKTFQGFVSIGGLTFYLRSLGSFSDQLSSLSYGISRAIDSSIRLKDALELFENYQPETDGQNQLVTQNKPPVVNLENVSFTYDNGKSPVIRNFNLKIESGEKVAIVGENGAGKTTLVKLITRVYRPQIGRIDLNGIDINDLKKTSLHDKFGILFQDFNTYGNLTVSENIRIGDISKEVSKDLLKQVLNEADALDFVKKYPKYLDQVLSERYKEGIRPSGGQWQKIAIARLFYRDAPILILDEPTASIDAVSEARIFDNVYKFMNGKTVIIISHRFSTVRNADRILVLDKGKIIEEGTHETLMKKKGKYFNAFSLQAKGYK